MEKLAMVLILAAEINHMVNIVDLGDKLMKWHPSMDRAVDDESKLFVPNPLFNVLSVNGNIVDDFSVGKPFTVEVEGIARIAFIDMLEFGDIEDLVA
jgi:hypothetical protein